MDLMQTKSIKRHELMFRLKRLRENADNNRPQIISENQREGNQIQPFVNPLFKPLVNPLVNPLVKPSVEPSVKPSAEPSLEPLRRWLSGKNNPFRDIIRFDGFEFIYDKEFLSQLRQLKQQLNIYVTQESKLKSRRFGHNTDDVGNEFNEKKNELLKKIREHLISIENDDKKDREKTTTLKKSFRFSDYDYSQPLDLSFFKPIDNNCNESDVEEDSKENIDNEIGANCRPKTDPNLLEAIKTENSIHLMSWLRALPIPNNCEVKQEITTQEEDDDEEEDKEEDKEEDEEEDSQQMNGRTLSERQQLLTRNRNMDFIDIQPIYSQTSSQMNSQMNSQMYSQINSQNSSQINRRNSSQTISQLKRNHKNSYNYVNNNQSGGQQSRQSLQITNRHKWNNTEMDPHSRVINLKADPDNKVRTQRKRRHQLKFVLSKIYELIESDIYITKRDLYYQNVNIFDKSQRVVDEIIDDLACSLRSSRTLLHIVSSTRGLVFGHLKFINTNGVFTDCLSSPNGINIPNDTERITQMRSNAEFVLFIEKDATFQQFIDLKIHKKFPLIMITGVGYPCLNTRSFIQMLWNTFEIPIFGLVDADPNGVEILCTIKHGSLALSYESGNIVTPAIHWLGILPTDMIDFRLGPHVQIELNERDLKKIEDLKKRPYMKANPIWNNQLNWLLRIGKKVEIQSLNQFWPTYLLDVYLPAKIRYGNWI